MGTVIMAGCTVPGRKLKASLETRKEKDFQSQSKASKSQMNMAKNMARNMRDISYTIVRPHQLPEVHKLMYQSFHKDEPMTNHLGLCKGSFSIPDSDEMVEGLVLDHNLSIMAMDRETNTPLAVVLNGEMGEEELKVSRSEVVSSCVDPTFVPIASILHEVQLLSKEIFTRYQTDRMFDIKMIATSPQARGLGLATGLVQRSVQLAACLGYKGCKTEATGAYSRKAFTKAGS